MAGPTDRRTVILHHAADLFASKGIVATTVREIADAVGILSGSLYHHFKSKDEMVSAIVTSYLDDLAVRYDQVMAAGHDPRTELTELVRGSLAVIEAHPHATEIYQNSGAYLASLAGYDHIRVAAHSIQKTWITVLEAGGETGAFRDDIPPRVLYRMLRDALWLSVRWLKPTSDYPMSRFADDFVSTFLDGIVPRTPEHHYGTVQE
ncbi:TetR/AcrR family transcriptional regulator [Actinokineospora sp. NBRC 105648]|uniref:TetR/AcrR family transcriptional regulator n=1 Tax=Actinokineospora sp. NBRC 105648 TaxID=3032206 RepID=UPI00249FBBB9|nr:TetR/AcrR family transcriptional regulator [Actinokineospora sp. NBRC 105648]GLZ42016.1 HTH-type transcriptional repressor KstR2 [Actinokineospora sp. NBRC 105648]